MSDEYSGINPNTHDPEYNTEAIHSGENDPWFMQKEPADETYHPLDELLLHEYAPQERERVLGEEHVPAYTPRVNTGGEYEPEPYDPVPEEHNMHIVTYGTVEDVAFAEDDPDSPDNPDNRRSGLVSMSIRDEMDDLIHTDFHSLNPLSLLDGKNVMVGDRVRVDIQDYKNVIEWFVYNYPMLLKSVDLLVHCEPDGPWFEEDMQATAQGDTVDKYGRTCKGGSIDDEPLLFNPAVDPVGEDWEHQDIGSQLDKSYLEIGQRDGNKKITIRQFLQLINEYFQIDEMWKTLRDHEKRLVHLERDVRKEDNARNNRVVKLIDQSYYKAISTTTDWSLSDRARGWPSVFVGNIEQRQFSLQVNFGDAAREYGQGAEDWWTEGSKHIGDRDANQIFAAGAIPEEFRPTKFQWVYNYGLAYAFIGGWDNLITGVYSLDFGFDPDGSVWVDRGKLFQASPSRDKIGIFGKAGDPAHMGWLGVVNGSPAMQKGNWHIQMRVASFGGIITMGAGGEEW